MTHDYKRHGTTTLFAALNVLDGTVIGRCMQRHRHHEFIRFLNAVERRTPAGKADPRDPRQLRHSQASEGQGVARPASALDLPLHTNLRLLGEGINGTVAGSPEAIAELIAHLEAIPGMAGLEVKFSAASTCPSTA